MNADPYSEILLTIPERPMTTVFFNANGQLAVKQTWVGVHDEDGPCLVSLTKEEVKACVECFQFALKAPNEVWTADEDEGRQS